MHFGDKKDSTMIEYLALPFNNIGYFNFLMRFKIFYVELMF